MGPLWPPIEADEGAVGREERVRFNTGTLPLALRARDHRERDLDTELRPRTTVTTISCTVARFRSCTRLTHVANGARLQPTRTVVIRRAGSGGAASMGAVSGTFSGTELARRHVAGLHVVESVHPPDQSIPWHSHQWPYFTFVLRGAYTEQCPGRAFDIGEGDVVLHGTGESHADRMHRTDSHLLNLEFTQPWIDRVAASGGCLDARITAKGGYLLQLGARLHRELWREDRLAALCIEAIALELVAEISRTRSPGPSRPRWLERSLEYLQAHFREVLTLAQVAAAAEVHQVHLARDFRRRQGMTVGDYIRTLRIDWACRELVATERPIVEIAIDAGFCDHSHMTRVFRRHTGLTPTEFRAQRRRDVARLR
jgi:AraC family transcriptional regulator